MKYETNRVTGKPNMRKTRVENRKEGKPWRANCREFIWQLVAVAKAQPGFSATASSGRVLLPLWELAMARLPQWSGFEVARVLELLCLPFSSKGGRCTLHCIQIESTHSYCDCVCVSVAMGWPDRLWQSVCGWWKEPEQFQGSYEITKEQQETGSPNGIGWGLLFSIFTCLLFKLKVKSVSTTTTVRSSLCINRGINNLFSS